MSDMIDGFRDLKDLRQSERRAFGLPCPVCREKLPKAHPKILQPGQLCRAHKPHYRDPRPKPTPEQWNEAMNGTGWSRSETDNG
jgi:hypothetical protein